MNVELYGPSVVVPHVAHVLIEPCLRCGFTRSAHIDGRCPNGSPIDAPLYLHRDDVKCSACDNTPILTACVDLIETTEPWDTYESFGVVPRSKRYGCADHPVESRTFRNEEFDRP